MVIIKKQEKQTLKEAGRRLASVLDKIISKVIVGATEKELDEYAYGLITGGGDSPAFLHYRPAGAGLPYPATLCVSVNDTVVHGIPKDYRIQEGDIVSLDIGLEHNGIIVDMAKTVPVGRIDAEARKLLQATEGALYRGIAAIRPGGRIGDIGSAISSFVKISGFTIVRELGGHGVGKKVHEEPFIPNFGKNGTGPLIKEGMVLAVEPIVNEGSGDIVEMPDGYTLKTKDGKRSAHFEHTILVTPEGGEIITKI